jgi:hypothetical protein
VQHRPRLRPECTWVEDKVTQGRKSVPISQCPYEGTRFSAVILTPTLENQGDTMRKDQALYLSRRHNLAGMSRERITIGYVAGPWRISAIYLGVSRTDAQFSASLHPVRSQKSCEYSRGSMERWRGSPVEPRPMLVWSVKIAVFLRCGERCRLE